MAGQCAVTLEGHVPNESSEQVHHAVVTKPSASVWLRAITTRGKTDTENRAGAPTWTGSTTFTRIMPT